MERMRKSMEREKERKKRDEGMEEHEERAEEERHRRRAIRSAAAGRGGKAVGAFPRALPWSSVRKLPERRHSAGDARRFGEGT